VSSKPAELRIVGPGWVIGETDNHPAGWLFSGGYDSNTNTIYLGSVIGHPRGVSLAGGDPSHESLSGMRVLVTEHGGIFWATDSMSLPRGVSELEAMAIQTGLEAHFSGCTVKRAESLEHIQVKGL
jgi:hypothetical protein